MSVYQFVTIGVIERPAIGWPRPQIIQTSRQNQLRIIARTRLAGHRYNPEDQPGMRTDGTQNALEKHPPGHPTD